MHHTGWRLTLPATGCRQQQQVLSTRGVLGTLLATRSTGPRALTVIQVQLVQLPRLSLDRYGNGGQTMITVLTHLGRWGPGGWLTSQNLRRLVLLVAHPGGVCWAAGLRTGWLVGTRR